MSRVIALCVVMSALSAGSAHAQSWELSALAGYGPAVDLEQQSRDVDSVSIGGGFMFTIQGARFLTPNWGVEVSFTQQYSSYDVTINDETGTLFSMDIAQLHGDVVYEFGESGNRLRPFVFGGAGASFISARDLPGETKLSFGAGGGAKMFLSPNVGVRAQIQYRPIVLGDDEEGDFCDPFGFCQSMLRRFEFAAGISFRF
jgi:opacity protein-like surface antigen